MLFWQLLMLFHPHKFCNPSPRCCCEGCQPPWPPAMRPLSQWPEL